MTIVLIRALAAAAFVLGLTVSAQSQEQLRLELEEVVVIPEGGAPGVVQAQSGTIIVRDSDVSIDYQFTPPPQVIGPEGASMTLTAAATRLNGEYFVGIGVMAPGFILDPPNPGVNFWAEWSGSSQTAYLHVRPDPNLQPGDTATISVGVIPETNIVYRYRVAGGAPPPRAFTVTHDCPTDLEISAGRPTLCNLSISGFSRDTAAPVTVTLPDMLDTFGNHANGIQVLGQGQGDTFEWDDPRLWGLTLYACPSPANVAMNCYDNVTTPGPQLVRVIVEQAGVGRVELTLAFNAIARNSDGGGASTVSIGNRWKVGEFIHIERGAPESSTILWQWMSARWNLEPVEGTGFVRIGSAWQPGIYLHIQNGSLEAGGVDWAWESAQWAITPSEVVGAYRICNRWQGEMCLHIENGHLEAGLIQPQWWSAMWWLQP
ncbi:MAG TPA: hypothetical protein PLA85_00975 [Micropepsaceae bacterium]|nr:hypothetical protein [Micropepsaceae bacterium]